SKFRTPVFDVRLDYLPDGALRPDLSSAVTGGLASPRPITTCPREAVRRGSFRRYLRVVTDITAHGNRLITGREQVPVRPALPPSLCIPPTKQPRLPPAKAFAVPVPCLLPRR